MAEEYERDDAIPYIVAWTEKEGRHYTDHYNVFFDFKLAEAEYEHVRKYSEAISVHILLPFRSTDYNTITIWG